DSSAPTDKPAELILRGWAQLAQHGFPAGVDLCAQAARALCEKPSHEESDLPLLIFSCAWATSFWDLEVLRLLAGRAVQLARDSGALQHLPHALLHWCDLRALEGDFQGAAAAIAEAEAVQEATTGSRVDTGTAWLDAFRLPEAQALDRIDLQEHSQAT